MKSFKKGQLVRLVDNVIHNYPYKKNQLGIVVGYSSFESNTVPAEKYVKVYLQEDKILAIVEPWNLELIQDKENVCLNN